MAVYYYYVMLQQYNNYNYMYMYITGMGPQLPALIQYDLIRTSSTGVCITCTFLESFATDCVAVVHQRISQLSFSRLMNIESSHKFTRSSDTAYGCIEGVNLEQYQVGVIGGKMIIMEPKSEPDQYFIAHFLSS